MITCIARTDASDDTSVAILERQGSTARLHFHETVTAANGIDRGINPARVITAHQANLAALVNRSLPFLPEASPHNSSPLVLNSHLAALQTPKTKPDFITVTRGPGITVALSIGLEYAKGLSTAWQVPLIAVNHMQAHALTPRLAHALTPSTAWPQPEFPFLSLLVSGGHTMLHLSKSIYRHKLLAETKDVALGNALDQIARSILPSHLLTDDVMYAREMEKFAAEEETVYEAPQSRGGMIRARPSKWGWTLGLPLAETRELAFSYSGLESSVRRICQTNPSLEERRDLARESCRVASEHLADRVLLALGEMGSEVKGIRGLVVGGGVASNVRLREV